MVQKCTRLGWSPSRVGRYGAKMHHIEPVAARAANKTKRELLASFRCPYLFLEEIDQIRRCHRDARFKRFRGRRFAGEQAVLIQMHRAQVAEEQAPRRQGSRVADVPAIAGPAGQGVQYRTEGVPTHFGRVVPVKRTRGETI